MDLAAGPGRELLGLVVIAPLLAASITGRRLTTGYAVLALLVAVLLGVYDDQYTADAWPTQAAQLFGVVLGGLIAVGACDLRLAREDRLGGVNGGGIAGPAPAPRARRPGTPAPGPPSSPPAQ